MQAFLSGGFYLLLELRARVNVPRARGGGAGRGSMAELLRRRKEGWNFGRRAEESGKEEAGPQGQGQLGLGRKAWRRAGRRTAVASGRPEN